MQRWRAGRIMPDRIERARAHIIIAFGPYQVKVGDTLKVDMAEIFGSGSPGSAEERGSTSRSSRARTSAFRPRRRSPLLRVTTTNHEVYARLDPAGRSARIRNSTPTRTGAIPSGIRSKGTACTRAPRDRTDRGPFSQSMMSGTTRGTTPACSIPIRTAVCSIISSTTMD